MKYLFFYFVISLNTSKNTWMIIELFRHGIRTEITFHESNPFPDHRYGVGDLIELGMKEHYLLGKKLR